MAKLNRLKEVREATGRTQEMVADDLGVKLGTYRSWEQGQRGLNGKRLSMLADYFNTTVDDILGFEPEVYEVTRLDEERVDKLLEMALAYSHGEGEIESTELGELLNIFMSKLDARERRFLLTVARSMVLDKEE